MKLLVLQTVFYGTSDFGLPLLRALAKDDRVDLRGVFTQPDRRKGRGRRTQSPPVADLARERGLRLFQPEDVNREGWAALEDLGSVDLGIVIAYGQILSQPVFDHPRLGTVNFHASLLPRWRGASPIRHAILEGDSVTGVTVFRVEEDLDTGPICFQKSTEVHPGEDYGHLFERLSRLNVSLLDDLLDAAGEGSLPCSPQRGEPTYAPRLSKEDARIDWSNAAVRVERKVRALCPSPGAYTFRGENRIKLYSVEVVETELSLAPGMSQVRDGRWLVQTGQGVVSVRELQPAGSRRMDVESFLRGRDLDGEDVRLE